MMSISAEDHLPLKLTDSKVFSTDVPSLTCQRA